MNELMIFNNPEFGTIRAIEVNGEPWLVGKDVAEALGYSNPRDALDRHVDDEDKATVGIHDGSQSRNMTIINESGLYSLVLSSKLPGAKKFKRWVTSEVLPSVRRAGSYSFPVVPPIVKQRCLTTDDYLKAAAIVAGCRNERMPYVLGFLRQAGFSVPEVQNRRRELGGELMQVLNEETNVHGFSTRQLGALTGIDFGTISAYRRGRYRPNETRAEYIIQIVRRAMEDRVNERP
jgi:hypothetical protein